MSKTYSNIATIIVGAVWASATSYGVAYAGDPFYLEKRNDLGLVAYCSENAMLPEDSEAAFKAGLDAIFGEVAPTPEGDLHEQKGREGASYLEGEEQSLEDLAAANNVQPSEVCGQYKLHVTLGRKLLTEQ